MMRRTFLNIDDNSLSELSELYTEFREKIAKDFSDINKGRKYTESQRKKNSENQKNCVIVRHRGTDINSSHFKVSIFDPEYLNGNLITNTTGTTKSKETKKLMSENGIKGKSKYHNPETNESIYVWENEEIPQNFIKGESNKFKTDASNKFIDSKYYYNPITKEQKRYKNILDVPEGWIHGKIFFGEAGNIFGKYRFYKNYLTGESGKLLFDSPLPKYCAGPTAKDAFIINDIVTFNIETASNISGFTINTLRIIRDTPFGIINNKTRDLEIKQYIGKRYNELGVIHIKIHNFFELTDYSNFQYRA
jgi:hypothetical protein